jgi:hypothetical protein
MIWVSLYAAAGWTDPSTHLTPALRWRIAEIAGREREIHRSRATTRADESRLVATALSRA